MIDAQAFQGSYKGPMIEETPLYASWLVRGYPMCDANVKAALASQEIGMPRTGMKPWKN